MNIINKIDHLIDVILETICVFFLILLFLILVLNVFFRFVPLYSMGWFDEIVELSFTSLTFFGAAYLWKKREHSRIDFLQEKYENTNKEFLLEIFISVLGLVFAVIFFKYSMTLINRVTAWSPIFKISRKVFYASMPISAAFMGIYSVRDLVVFGKRLKAGKRTSAND